MDEPPERLDGIEQLDPGRRAAVLRIAGELERCTPADALQVASALARTMGDPALTVHARRVLFVMVTFAGLEAGAQRQLLEQIDDELRDLG